MRISDWSSDVCSSDLQKGVISGYAARIDPLALGLEVQSFVEVQIRFDAHAELEAAVPSHPAVAECHTTAGDSDYVLKVFARSVGHLAELPRYDMSKLPGLHPRPTRMCPNTLNRTAPLSYWARPHATSGDEEAVRRWGSGIAPAIQTH